MTERTYTISEMCADFGVTPRTLRYYEYIELLAPRREGTRRIYSQRDRARLKLILRGRRFGFSLESIRRWLKLYDEGDQIRQAEVWIESATRRIAELERERREIAERIAELTQLRDEGIQWLAEMRGEKGAA
ncbi:MAG: MerR family transcriptional regulator [Alphaproteobacteria bacterium]|nr:MAG: MerR family transcriptional regulator [Alphaproteobacteria bacterium]